VLFWSGTRAWTDCRLAGEGERGDSCRDHSDCQRGLFCRGGRCSQYCRRDDEGGKCSGDAHCVTLDFLGVSIGTSSYGYCIPDGD
jgi:hypothetical protein